MKHLTWIFLVVLSAISCGTEPGDRIPDFSYADLDGNTLTSDDLKGKATVLCVWATWCGDCIREIPELNALKQKYADNDQVRFVAFSDEDKATVERSLQRYPFEFTHLVNTKSYTDQLISGMTKHFPQVMVVNSDLEIVFEVTENKEPIFDKLDQHIQAIIN